MKNPSAVSALATSKRKIKVIEMEVEIVYTADRHKQAVMHFLLVGWIEGVSLS